VRRLPLALSLRMVAFWSAFLALDTATQLFFKKASQGLEGLSFGLSFIGTALTIPAFWLMILCYIGTFLAWMAVLTRSFPSGVSTSAIERASSTRPS